MSIWITFDTIRGTIHNFHLFRNSSLFLQTVLVNQVHLNFNRSQIKVDCNDSLMKYVWLSYCHFQDKAISLSPLISAANSSKDITFTTGNG